MSGDYLLDSNIVIELFKGNEEIIEKIKGVNQVFIAVIVLGELYYGANRSSKPRKKVLEIEGLEKRVTILECKNSTARIYGEIKNQLRAQGTPIPENDIWIAAIAREYNLILATRDNHFNHVKDIRLERW